MKKVFIVLAVIAVIIAGLAVVKDQLIKSAVLRAAKTVLGVPVEIDGLSLGILKPSIRIKGFRIYNPKGFPKGVIVDVPEVSVRYDLKALLKKKLHLEDVVFNLKEIDIVKNKDSAINIDSLRPLGKNKAKNTEGENKKSEPLAIKIDTLRLTIGKLVYKDFSTGGKPSVSVSDINIKNKVYRNINSVQKLAILILTEPAKQAGIKGGAIYGIAAALGTAILPVGAAAILTGKDSSSAEFNKDYGNVYNAALSVMKKMGNLKSENESKGVIKGSIGSTKVAIGIVKKDNGVIKINVSARQYVLPKPKVAAGLLHEISEALK